MLAGPKSSLPVLSSACPSQVRAMPLNPNCSLRLTNGLHVAIACGNSQFSLAALVPADHSLLFHTLFPPGFQDSRPPHRIHSSPHLGTWAGSLRPAFWGSVLLPDEPLGLGHFQQHPPTAGSCVHLWPTLSLSTRFKHPACSKSPFLNSSLTWARTELLVAPTPNLLPSQSSHPGQQLLWLLGPNLGVVLDSSGSLTPCEP